MVEIPFFALLGSFSTLFFQRDIQFPPLSNFALGAGSYIGAISKAHLLGAHPHLPHLFAAPFCVASDKSSTLQRSTLTSMTQAGPQAGTPTLRAEL